MKFLLTALVLCSVATTVYSSACEAKYEKEENCKEDSTPDCSTMECLPEVKCVVEKNGVCGDVSEEHKKHILELHNNLRAKIARGELTEGKPGPHKAAVNMRELKWDEDLADHAERLANQQVWKHDCSHCRKSTANPSQGQNMFLRAAWPSYKYDWREPFNDWFSEVEWYDGQTLTDTFGMSGHYTQLIWAKTTKIGCAAYRNGNNCSWRKPEWAKYTCIEYVCNYAVSGNMKDEKPYSFDEKDRCSERSATYPDLCA